MDASAPPPTTAAAAVAAAVRQTKRRAIFRVALDPNAPSEINFKELARAFAAAAPPSTTCSNDTNGSSSTTDAATLNGSAHTSESDLPVAPAGPRSQRFNIIERLEKRYGGGAVVDCSEGVGALDVGGAGVGGRAGGGGGGFERGEEDDYYDSEDSFIDDEELQQNIEDIHGQAKVKTKHAGFFVNAGDEIETIERDEKYVCYTVASLARCCADVIILLYAVTTLKTPAASATTARRAKRVAPSRPSRSKAFWTSGRTRRLTGALSQR